MDTAVNLQCDISVSDDGTWSYMWGWTYAGSEGLSEVHEELLLSDESGNLYDGAKEVTHSAEPGQTYLAGTTYVDRRLRPGTVNWSFRVLSNDGYLGMTGGSFTAMIPYD